MKSLFWTLGLIAIAAVAFAEEEPEVSKPELSETGKAVLAKLRALRLEEEGILDAITVETDRAIIHSILKTEVEVSNNSDDDSDEVDAAAPRVKRAVRRRGGRRRRAHRRRAVAARRRFFRRLRRNRRRAARRRAAHRRRHLRNLRRAARRRG